MKPTKRGSREWREKQEDRKEEGWGEQVIEWRWRVGEVGRFEKFRLSDELQFIATPISFITYYWRQVSVGFGVFF